jgi:hypothetical protein
MRAIGWFHCVQFDDDGILDQQIGGVFAYDDTIMISRWLCHGQSCIAQPCTSACS